MDIERLRRKFLKESPAPINLVMNPYFDHFMNLYNPIYGCIGEYSEFMETVKACGGEEGYQKHMYQFIDTMVSTLTSTESYKTMQGMKHVIEYEQSHAVQNGEIYHPKYKDIDLISIDLKSANFNALRSFDPNAVLGCETYDELVSQFTPYKYIQKNKQIRQVLFGKMNPSKLIQIMKAHLSMICDNILDQYPNFEIVVRGSDECVVVGFGDMTALEAYPLILGCIPRDTYVRAEVFTLRHIHPERHYFVKEPLIVSVDKTLEDDSYSVTVEGRGLPVFKTIPQIFFAQAYKHYFGLPIEDNDLHFLHEGQVCRFVSRIYND